MKKGIGIATTAIALLLFAGYFATGFLIEKRMHEEVNLINNSPNVDVSMKDYKRGWFNSTASLVFKVSVPQKNNLAANNNSISPLNNLEFSSPINITHGPIIFSKDKLALGLGYASTQINLSGELAKKIEQLFEPMKKPPVLKLSLMLSYLMNTDLKVNVPAFKLVIKDNKGSFSWLGLTTKVKISSDIDDVEGTTTLSGMDIVGPKGITKIGSLKTSYQVAKNDKGLWLGKARFAFPSMIITKNGKNILELVDLKASSASNVDNNLFSQVADLSLKQLVVNGKKYGPGEFSLALKNLDSDALVKLNEQFNAISQADKSQRQLMMLPLITELPKLVKHGAKFEISKMNVVIPEGEIKAVAEVSVPKGNVSNPLMLMKNITASSSVQFPASIVKEILVNMIIKKTSQQQMMKQAIANQLRKQQQLDSNSSASVNPTDTTLLSSEKMRAQAISQVDEQLAKLVTSGVLNLDGDYYKIKVDFNQAKLLVNNKPFNPAMLNR